MSLNNLPTVASFEPLANLYCDVSADALSRWQPDLKAIDEEPASISIYEQIGEDFFGEGMTARRFSAILRSIGDRAVTVNINSPGGSVFDGVAIYNALASHQHSVTVRVVGLAASAASFIAMAGDRIEMAPGSMMMVHNASTLAWGDKAEMLASHDLLDKVDASMAGIYEARTGNSDVSDQIRAGRFEQYYTADEAVAAGLADVVGDFQTGEDGGTMTSARAKLDVALARSGMPRSERRRLIKESYPADMPGAISPSTPSAADHVTPSADDIEALQELLAALTQK